MVDVGIDQGGRPRNLSSIGSDNPIRESAWLTHAYDGFPREVWNGDNTSKWKTVKTREEYLAILRDQHDNFSPGHTSINIAFTPGFDATKKPWINKLLIELDGHGRLEESAYPEMRKLYSHLESKHSAEPRIYYSGNRSFHVFVDFAPLTLREPREAQVEFVRRIQEELRLQCIDYQVYTKRKLSRIPYTMHEKTALHCVPIDPMWSLWKIKQEALRPRGQKILIRPADKFAAALSICDHTYERPIYAKTKTVQSAEWIEKLLRSPVVDGRHRLLWLVLAPYVVNVKALDVGSGEERLRGYYDQCHLLNRLQPSRSSFFRVIRYYVSRAAREGYRPARLETIQAKDPGLYQIIKQAINSPESQKSEAR